MSTSSPVCAAILSVSESFYSTRRLLEAGRGLGLDMRRIDPIRVLVHAGPGGPALTDDGQRVPVPEVVVPRVGSRLTEWSLAMLTALVDAGARCVVPAAAIRLAGDKLAATQRLAAAGLPTLATVAVREQAHIPYALEAVGGPPVVLKLIRGTQGTLVMTATDTAGALSTLGALVGLGHTVLVQRRVMMDRPRDLRVLMAGGEPLAACWRLAADGEFRANVHRGAAAAPATLTPELADLAARAAAAIGLPVCGVDLLPTDDGWVVLEVNGSPGLEGIERATGRDLATDVLRSMI